LITKEDIDRTEHDFVEAERMLEDVTDRHIMNTFDHERLALKRIQESEDFQMRVDIFRKELVWLSNLAKIVC
jgi:hypothetical protein